jgi:hypothetical protein
MKDLKDNVLQFYANVLHTRGWMIPYINNFQTLTPLEHHFLQRLPRKVSSSNIIESDMDIPMEYYKRPEGDAKYSFTESDWKQFKVYLFEYEVINTWIGTYVRPCPESVFLLQPPSCWLHRVVQEDLREKGKLPLSVKVNGLDTFHHKAMQNTFHHKAMVLYSNRERYYGPLVLTCLGFMKHGDSDVTSYTFDEGVPREVSPSCDCMSPELIIGRDWNVEYSFNPCRTHKDKDEEAFDKVSFAFFANLLLKYENISVTADEVNTLRLQERRKGKLLLMDQLCLTKCDTVELYDRYIEPTEAVKKDEKTRLNLKEIGIMVTLLRLNKDE